MPLYDYQCGSCHGMFSQLRSMAKRHEPSSCSRCGTGQLHYRLTAPSMLISKASPFRAATPQQQLAGPSVSGPGTHAHVKSSVLHQCIGPNCAVCA